MAQIKKLCETQEYVKYFKDIQQHIGYDLFKRFQDIENIISRKIDEKYRHFLARPEIESDSITWYSKTYNETPQHLSELADENHSKYEQIKNETLNHYKSVINFLFKQEQNRSGAECLEKAIKFINDDFVYCFEDKVVLGVWGMQLREEVREPIGTAVKNQFMKKPDEQPILDEPLPDITKTKPDEQPIPDEPPPGITKTKPDEQPIPTISWYKRFWNWLKNLFGKGCLKWLLWLLLLLLLLFLFSWLFRSCKGNFAAPIPYPITDKPWIHDDPRSGGIGNPGDPYKPIPTPPEYRDILPPQQGILPPIDTTKIIRDPDNPLIIDNRLNVLMENEDKSIMDLARDFKAKYPDDKYKIVYYNDVVKRMQIEVSSEERAQLKMEIPAKFASEYELFVFDEALFETNYTPNDPAFNDPNKSWYLKAINAPQAWDITKGNDGDRGLTIAIVDNGFTLEHPELSSKVVMPYNVWLNSNEVFPQQIDHGTHVAGTALAIMDNEIGISGIAPKSAFMPVQVANKQGIMTTTSILDGILYALYQGADVINISLGTKFSSTLPENVQQDMQNNRFKEEERLWNHVMKISNKHKSIIVIAAGNDDILAGVDPMNRPKNFIVVSAVDKDNRQYRKAGFSNYGDYSTISAPGVDIYSTVGNKKYKTMDGTSMAAPIVSGTIALMKSLNENLTAEQIICILQSTGLAANGKIGNVIQMDKALQKVQSGEFTNCDNHSETPSTGDVQVLLNWNNYNDLDLACVDPNKDMVWFKNKRVPSGGILEIDMNVKPNDNQAPIENIYWPQDSAPNGTYEVYLWLYKQHEVNINETPYKITVKYGSKIEEFTGTIKKEDGRVHITTFTLGNANNRKNPNNPNIPPSNNRRNELLKERENFQRKIDEIDNELSNLNNKEKR